jgi:hypothetical protein
MPARRFPPPWFVEELNNACFVVRDHNRQQTSGIPAANRWDNARAGFDAPSA